MARRTRTTDPARLLRAARAFTLAEALIASVVLAIAVVGIAGTLAASYDTRTSSDEDATAATLARTLLEEIAAKPFATTASSSGWSAGNKNRATYVNVADYQGYTDENPFRSLDGQEIDLEAAYRRSVNYTCPATITASGTTMTSNQFGLVTVTVTSKSGRVTRLSRLLTDYVESR
jgi:Tfp pilus assembly protein PilV